MFLGQGSVGIIPMPLLIFVVVLYIAALTTINKLSKADYRSGFYPQARPIDYNVDL